MERLTEKDEHGNAFIVLDENSKEWSVSVDKPSYTHTIQCEAIDKLADYEDAEEQGLLLRLPCKVGDTVYKLGYKPCHNGEEWPDSYSCCGCEDECDLKKAIFEIVVPNVEWTLQHMKCFGDGMWFLTREEAEKALEDMKGKV